MLKDPVSFYVCCILLIIPLNKVFPQEKKVQPVRLMFYNVENLFDIYNDTARNDDDFLPGGAMRWTYPRYHNKIGSIYKTIVAAGSWDPPDIVAFCEVESRKVLEDLVNGTYLSKFNYGIVHEDSPDPRGIDVCLIYRQGSLDLVDYRYWIPPGFKIEEYRTRSILYARFSFRGDTFHIIMNHWPSRRGGVLAGEELRGRIASFVRSRTDSIFNAGKGSSKIIIAGDFNCTPEDKNIKALELSQGMPACMVNLSERLSAKGQGTYRYRGAWEMIDQVIVSCCLTEGRTGLYTGSSMLKIFMPEFLLTRDPAFPGQVPFATYRGYRYQGGISDHLPVLLDLEYRDPQE
jgi:predicted extracellular nuclease